MTDEVITRLYRVLIEELQRKEHPESQPVKVSDLYQTLVPYRAVRSALGVELNADYEHALLRLLSGERGLLRLEPAEAREELRREVDAPYPFVGLFRKFSASDVWIDMPEAGKIADGSGHPKEGQAAPAANAVKPLSAPGSPAFARDEPPPGEAGTRIAAESEPVRLRAGGGAEPARERPAVHLHPPAETRPVERLTHTGAACAFCGDELPAGRRVRFCPHCGGDQRLQPCPRCEAVLERDWRYCISCGQETSGA